MYWDTPIDMARQSLLGLSVGDALGEGNGWHWSDDTAMAISITECLLEDHEIDQDKLIRRFVLRFEKEPHRGYGPGAGKYLRSLIARVDSPDFREIWRREVKLMFGGQGSYGNGSAMRVAPIGAYFHKDMPRVVYNAAKSADVTHAHPEGKAGAIAIAAATSLIAERTTGIDLIKVLKEIVPGSVVQDGLSAAIDIPLDSNPLEVGPKLGTGLKISCQDTVPFCIWLVAKHTSEHGDIDNAYRDAVADATSIRGDRDTMGAIVGGIMALYAPIPREWLEKAEKLPEGLYPK